MCKTNPTCDCPKNGSRFQLNYSANQVKRIKYNGRDTAVVPLVMAISSVVMNDAMIPLEEFEPDVWNGVPLTIGHPENDDGSFLSANTPQSLIDWCAGRIFNAEVKGDKLCAEAYVDVVQCQRISPETWKIIQSGEPLDVSTGYFADVELEEGVHNGVKYKYIHRELRPDHLALLPNEVGACNWDDGCGVRANKRSNTLNKIKKALGFKAKVKNEEVEKPGETDLEAMVAGIIQSDDSPFTEEDAEGLRKMSAPALKALSATYMPKEEEAVNEDPPSDTDEGSAEPEGNGAAMKNKKEVLTAEDREALAFARNHLSSHKASLIAKIVANSKMTKKTLETFSAAQLQEIADGLVIHEEAEADYSGRAVPALNEAESDEAVKAMSGVTLSDVIKNRSKKKGS